MSMRLLPFVAGFALASACRSDPGPEAAKGATEQVPAAPAKVEPSPTDPDGPALAPGEPLTPEEEALIAKDPKTLTPEERRARSFALRKKIMRNPKSEAAKAVREGAEAIERGDMQVPSELLGPDAAPAAGGGMQISAPDL